MRIEWTELARDRVDEIALHIAQDDREAALRWSIELLDAVARLAEFPESGRIVPELEAREVRELIYGDYRVFYRVGTTVTIMTVRHGSQLLRRDELDGT